MYQHRAEARLPWGSGTRLVVPITDSGRRLGVACFDFPADALAPDEEARSARARLVSWAAGLLLVAKGQLTDSYEQLVRRKEMSLAAELQWGLLPPLSFTAEGIAVAGILEPAYEIGGDSFDYALSGDRLDIAIFDAAGHGLPASLPAALAVNSARHSRRHDLDLATAYRAASDTIATELSDATFVTAILARLVLGTGVLSWVCAGHLPPLLVHHGAVTSLRRPPDLPLGLSRRDPTVHSQVLEPGDQLLLFTDGVVEGHARGAGPFGEARLAELLAREVAAGNPPPETVRRLAEAVLHHHAHVLRDDFTMVLIDTGPPAAT